MQTLQNLSYLLSDKIVVVILAITFAVFAFAFLTRKADPNASIMCGFVIVVWAFETVAKAHFGEAFRPLLPLTDVMGAWLAFELGKRRPSDWIFATYVTFAIAVAFHALWFLSWKETGVHVNKYKAILNALYTARLIFFAAPGVAYVGKVLGDYLHDRGLAHSVSFQRAKR